MTIGYSRDPEGHDAKIISTAGTLATSWYLQETNVGSGSASATASSQIPTNCLVRTIATFNTKGQPIGGSRGRYIKEGQFCNSIPEYEGTSSEGDKDTDKDKNNNVQKKEKTPPAHKKEDIHVAIYKAKDLAKGHCLAHTFQLGKRRRYTPARHFIERTRAQLAASIWRHI
ncbi:hypothetical protein DFH27DRAFT_521910 [Peziza echinospora]|nr:hypothetical protein DFH27DRAFT_521910 [Peziza echinospora]